MSKPPAILSAFRRLRPTFVESNSAEAVHHLRVAVPVGIRYHLAIPFDHARGLHGASPCADEIVAAARRLLREWTGQARLLGFDAASGLLWDLTDDEPVGFDRFDEASVHVLCNVAFLLLDAPPLSLLHEGAREHGACWTGTASSEDLLAYAFVAPPTPSLATPRTDALPLAALRLVTACVDHDVGDDWQTVAGLHRVPLAQGPERSPAMAGVALGPSRRTAWSPVYWNTAIADLRAMAGHGLPVNGDPVRMGQLLLGAMATTRVPFVLNALLNEIELRTGASEPDSHPVEIHLSMTGRCNIECRFCGYSHDTARSDVVTPEEMRHLDFLSCVGSLRLNSGLGEPTLNKHLGRIVTQVAERFPHLAINFFTNAIPLGRPGLIEAIVGKVRWINLSLNAATREEWEVQCKADHFDRVCENVAELTRVKRATGSLWPILHASMVLNRSNLHELALMPALCRRLGVDRLIAYPYFALGFGADKFGPEMTLASFRDDYDAVYDRTIEQARLHRVSIEIPLPGDRRSTSFGIEKRLLDDFAHIEGNDWPLARLLTGLAFEKPAGSHCHFLWRQGAIGNTNHAGQATDATHYMYPCLGPLSSVDLSRRTPFRFAPDFMGLWRNPVFVRLRDAQHSPGVCEVCDHCRASDTRDPAAFGDLERLVGEFSMRHGEIRPTVIDISALSRSRSDRSPAPVDRQVH